MTEYGTYLVLDCETNQLSIQSVDWSKFVFVPEEPKEPLFDELPFGIKVSDCENALNKQLKQEDFLKEQITKTVPDGVIVSRPRLCGSFYYDEWDVFNLIKFEIHSDFSNGLTYLELKISSRPIVDTTISFLSKLSNSDQPRYLYQESFEPSKEGWMKLYQRVTELQNSFVSLINSEEFDDTPYYNVKNQWPR